MKKTYDVFLSYHGGAGDPAKSSYEKAEELYDYLEEKGLSCFLYKKESNEDFYDSINDGLQNSKHFILVACEREMLSEWVRDEVKQFDGLRKIGRKPNCLISAYIFGSITESDLFDFNTLFTTKDIAKGPKGFERLYSLLLSKNGLSAPQQTTGISRATAISDAEKEAAFTQTNFQETNSAKKLSRLFLSGGLENYENFTDEDYETHCSLLTERLKCMVSETIPESCQNIVDKLYRETVSHVQNTPSGGNYMRVSGQAGTQKSYVLQMLYLWFLKKYDEHFVEPVYVHCETMREEIKRRGVSAAEYLTELFKNFTIPKQRQPLFIVDGLFNIVVDDLRLDYALKSILDRFPHHHLIVGIIVIKDTAKRSNPAPIIKEIYYKKQLNLTPISLYDKNKCLRYIQTIPDVETENPEDVYRVLNGSGLLTIDQFIIGKIYENYQGVAPDIMDIFENDILNELDGSEEKLERGAAFVFEFVYGSQPVDFQDPLHQRMLKTISRSAIYINCLMAIHFCNLLEKYATTQDFTFFNLVWPKEITRFITKKINGQANLEHILVQLAEHYNDLTPLGKSAMSFYLGRMKTPNYRARSVQLLNRYYEEANEQIKQRIIDEKFHQIPYYRDDYKQDMFLLRGLSVSLIYADNRGGNQILYEYLHSLIHNDLANSINRGFHLEYYGDKQYLPNQNTLDYEDKPTTGERTLRILCNSLDTHLLGTPNPSMLLELFTVVSLLQVRMETDAKKITFAIQPYMKRCCELIERVIKRLNVRDDLLLSYFKMATEDFKAYLDKRGETFSPARAICNDYLGAKGVKRAGWVMQNIEDPESIVEHMYSCWFIGLAFLPQTAEIDGYDKQAILNMLLVHDLAETKLSDIPKYEKIHYPDYEKTENDTMLNLLLKGTYASMSSLMDYVDAWRAWYQQEDENARIAKDIDTIQAIHQFLLYYLDFPENFSHERTVNWLLEIHEIHTELGKKILQELVLKNPLFTEIFQRFNGEF